MDFDPDEYLKQDEQFNPDAYLSGFDPDTYLSGEVPPTPSQEGNDLTSYLNPATMLDIGAGGLAKAFGDEEGSDAAFKSAQERITKSNQSTLTDTLKGSLMAPVDFIGGIPGFLAGGVAGAGNALINGPEAGLKTAQDIMHAMTPSKLLGVDVENNPAYQGAMLPVTAMSEGMTQAGQGYGEIAGVLGADEETKRKIAASVELGLIAAPAVHGVHSIGKKVLNKKEAAPKQESIPFDEKQIFQRDKIQVQDRIKELTEKIQSIEDGGPIGENTAGQLKTLTDHLTEMVQREKEIDSYLAGEVPVVPDLTADIKNAQDKAARPPVDKSNWTEPHGLIEPDVTLSDARRIDRSLLGEDVSPILAEKMTDLESTRPTEPVIPELKKSPVEVALEKIGEATQMSKAELADRTLTLDEKLSAIEDVPQNSQLRESMKQELKAYEAILDGKEPDLSWFKDEGKVEPTTQDIMSGMLEDNKPTVLEEITAKEAPKVQDIQEILSTREGKIEGFRDNPHLFTKREPTSSISFDSRIMETKAGQTLAKILDNFLQVTGLGKDEIYVVFDSIMADKTRSSFGDMTHTGNASMIRLNPSRLASHLADNNFKGVNFGSLVGKRLADAKSTYLQVRVAAHEVGHILFNKILRSSVTDHASFDKLVREFNKYKQKTGVQNISMFDYKNDTVRNNILLNQQHFHEFFAEQTARQLIHGHVLSAFSRGVSKTFQSLIDASVKTLKDHGIDVNKQNFVTELVNEVIAQNKESMKKTGQTIFEQMELARNEELLKGAKPGGFDNMTLEQVLHSRKTQQLLPGNPLVSLDIADLPVVSSRMLDALGRGSAAISRKFFGKSNIREFNLKDPKVQAAYWKIKDVEIKVEGTVNDLWYGKQQLGDIGWRDTFTKIKNAASPYVALAKSSSLDKSIIHDVFKKGFEEGLDYGDNLAKNGTHLNPEQVKYYNTFADLFKKMYEKSLELEVDLDKKHLMANRRGWYPATRSGNYAVAVNYGGLMSHVQNFQTRLQAEKFQQKLKENTKHHEISEVMDLSKEEFQTNEEMARIIEQHLSQKLPQARKFIEGEVQKVLDSMSTRGGVLGQHHKYRTNVTGYKGSELFSTPEQLGDAFGQSIETSIAEKGMQMKQMLLKTELEPVIRNEQFKQERPNSHAAIKQMYDSSMGRNNNLFRDVTKQTDYMVDKIIDETLKVFGSEKTGDKSFASLTHDGIKEAFYLTKMMPKMVFSTIGQLISVPASTISKASYGGHGLMAYKSFTKGTFKLMSGNKELWNQLKKVSQETNTFEAQFVESLSLQDASKPVYKALKDWLLLQAPGKASESLSRLWAFSILDTHYKDLGYSLEKRTKLSIDGVGYALNLYDKANSAPIFDHLGGIGDVMKPLQGFGQNQLGNLIGNIKHMSPKDYKTWGPMINYTLVTVAMSGTMGMIGVQEYEAFRRFVNKNFNDYTLPSILDVVRNTGDFIEDQLGTDTDLTETAMLGVPAATGLDLSSSARANMTLPALMGGILSGADAPSDALPMLSWGASIPGSMATLGRGMMGETGVGETRKAIENLAPSGHLGYGLQEIAGTNTTNVNGKKTNMIPVGKEAEANRPRTGMDILAGVVGTKTSKQRIDDMDSFNAAEEEMNLTAKKKRLTVRFTETGDKDVKQKLLTEMANLGMTDSQVQDAIGLNVYNRTVPQKLRLIFNKNGKVVAGRGERNAQRLFNFKR